MTDKPFALDVAIAKYLFGHEIEYRWVWYDGVEQEWKHIPCDEPRPVEHAIERAYLKAGGGVPYYTTSDAILLLCDLAVYNFFIELHYAGHGWRLQVYKANPWGKVDPRAHTDVFGKTIEDVLLDAMTRLVEQAKAQHG